MSVPSYSDIQHVAHNAVKDMWTEHVEIQEKVDGSQISFMLNSNCELEMRSKGQQLFEGAPSSKMFQEAIDSIKERKDLLVPGQIWRGEYLQKPKHNSLMYRRIPKGHIVIFDIELSLGRFASPEVRSLMSSDIGYETVPTLFTGIWDLPLTELTRLLERESFLGGPNIEGIVVKCYNKWIGGKPMMAKLVSEAFKEVHTKEWKKSNPTKGDIIDQIINDYRTEARWRKAVQHKKEEGILTDSPQDIGPLLKEISVDILKEEEDTIKERLFKAYWPQISRGVSRGFPEFYKNYLLEDE